MFTSTLLSAAAAFVLASTGADAVLNLNAQNNLALYWGQNYAAGNQQTLATYCANTAVDVCFPTWCFVVFARVTNH